MTIAVISRVLVPAPSILLTDLPTVKEELRIDAQNTDDDSFLNRAITQASSAIEAWCNNKFVVETLRDDLYPQRDPYPYQLPGGVAPLQLSRWPVIEDGETSVVLVAPVASGNVIPVASTSGLFVNMPVGGGIVVSSPPPPGVAPVSNIAPGTFITAITANTSVTLNQDITGPISAGATVWFGGAQVTVNDPVGTLTPFIPGQNFLVDGPPGQLVRLAYWTQYPTSWDAIQASVWYQAGYNPIPADVVDAALRLITDRWSARGRDPRLKSQDQPGIGIQTYWVGGPPSVRGGFPEEIADMLSNYRVPVTA